MSCWVYVAAPAGEVDPEREVLLERIRSCPWFTGKGAPKADERIRRHGRNDDGDVIACFSFMQRVLDVVDERTIGSSFVGTLDFFANPWVQV